MPPAPVKEVFRGQTVWDGTVEVFALTGHPKATRCYAWGYHADDKSSELRIVTALGIPPVDSPLAAVRVYIANETNPRTSGTPNERKSRQ